ncbi:MULTISPECIES: cysteine desulfurase family protein [unclassified Jeotgalibaca]|uniref:cysteine desulfurase family protein n=1 Tax=unclassified Jeotgalibaca TaxID=2621505 RepID=UPI003FD53247
MIYFDNSATTPIFPEALDTYIKVSQAITGNPSSLHKLGVMADQLLQQSRKQVADLLNVTPKEIFFTSGGTEGDNWVIKGTAIEKAVYGKHLITSAVEHPAVSKTMQQLKKLGFEITVIPVDEAGVVSASDVKEAIREDTILVSLMAINNEVGAIQPIREVGDILEDYPTIHYHVDAVQGLTEFDTVIQHPRIDFLVLSAHKFRGPKGVGIVYHKAGKRIASLLTGGGQESGERSSTENVPGIAATAKALRMALEKRNTAHQSELTLKNHLMSFLQSYDDVKIFSTAEGASHILCFAMKDVRGEVMVHAFENENIILSTTSACSSKKGDVPATLEAMHVPSEWSRCAVRISLSSENTLAEVETFKSVFAQLHTKFKKIQK